MRSRLENLDRFGAARALPDYVITVDRGGMTVVTCHRPLDAQAVADLIDHLRKISAKSAVAA